MKFLTISLLMLISLLCSAQASDIGELELGRSLANYQACSKVAVSINDEVMVNYYQRMFNDATISMLSINNEEGRLLYSVWDKSEKVLSHIGKQGLQEICLSRFDNLSRSLFNK